MLAGADPTDGLGLAARTAPYVQHYADRAERPSAALDTVRELLPGLPPGVAEAVLAGTPDGPWDGHPADRAVAGTVLLAGLLNLLGHKGLPGD